MPATNPQTLFEAAKCYLCQGVSQFQALKLALLARTLLVIDPAADTSASSLLAYGKCFECFGMVSAGDLMELSLLDMIDQAS